MNPSQSIRHVSDTAYWMATYRALESRHPQSLFQDPLAELLVGDHGKKIAQSMKSVSRYAYWSLIMRTCIIDDFILDLTKRGFRTLINIGAGLDTRPYRLNLPQDFHWIEIDFPSVIEMKNQKLANEKPNCKLERISLDLANRDERQKLFAELNQRISSALLLTEGVIPYLSEVMVSELASDLYEQSKFQFWIAEYYASELYPRFQSPEFSKLLGDSPFRFFPEDWFGVFKERGWSVKEKRYLFDEGERLKRSFPLPWWAKPLKLIADPEKFAQRMRMQAYVIFEKS